MDKEKLLIFSVVVSVIGVIILYFLYINTDVSYIDDVDESYIGKTVKTSFTLKDFKKFDDFTVLYSDDFRYNVFYDINVNYGDKIEVVGKIFEDKYGLYMNVDEIEVRKNI